MAKKNDDEMMDEFESEDEMEYDQDEELDFGEEDVDILLDEEEDEDAVPSVLYKGVSRPKTDDDWRQLLLQADREGVPEYLISESYPEGGLIFHPSFGLGVVSRVISQRKMEVIFETSKKLMAMNVIPPQ